MQSRDRWSRFVNGSYAGVNAIAARMSQPVHRRLRAPQEDASALVEPPQREFSALIERNQALARTWECNIGEQPLAELIRTGRHELLDRATRFTGGNVQDAHDRPLILTGHQPELFHPGVWFKNFLASAAAQRLGGVAINLIIDTDTVRSTSIRVPTRQEGDVAIENVAFDAAGDVVPFEERPILDSSLFATFARRVWAAYDTCFRGSEPYEPILAEGWPRAVAEMKAGAGDAKLGFVLARTRHWLEGQLGVQTLEVPLSSVAQTDSFRRFTVHLLMHLDKLLHIYNASLAEYRHVNHIRSSTHPVPALEEQGEWLESPFFMWEAASPRRRPLFARQSPHEITLSDRHGLEISLSISPDESADSAVEQLAAAEARRIKIRPRALITTMYARLVLSDLFIHGIGGAKYDELTDLIIHRFFGIEPPAYVTATATFRLPIERPDVSQDDVRKVARRIREARYRPESFLHEPLVQQDAGLSAKLQALAAEKRAYLAQHDLRRCSQAVFDQLDALNRAMHDLLRPIEDELRAHHAQLTTALKQSQLLSSREFSFVLFPSEILSARLLDLCKVLS